MNIRAFLLILIFIFLVIRGVEVAEAAFQQMEKCFLTYLCCKVARTVINIFMLDFFRRTQRTSCDNITMH